MKNRILSYNCQGASICLVKVSRVIVQPYITAVTGGSPSHNPCLRQSFFRKIVDTQLAVKPLGLTPVALHV